jgi:hypothetical protein
MCVVCLLLVLNPLACHVHCWSMHAEHGKAHSTLYVCAMGSGTPTPTGLASSVPTSSASTLVPLSVYPAVFALTAAMAVRMVLIGATSESLGAVASYAAIPTTPPPK